MPYASSIPGTAIAPISSIGSSTIGGSCQPVIDSSSPMSVPIVSGLVNGRIIMWRTVGRWPAHVGVEHGQGQRLEHEQLQQQRRCHERGIPEHVGRDRQAEVAGVDVRARQGPDDPLARPSAATATTRP